MNKVIGIAGSLRKASYNAALLRAAAQAAPAGLEVSIASIEAIPLYNGDLEKDGVPQAVIALKDAIASAQGLILATPEYNGSIPGVFKNVIDWLSRPASDIERVFGNKRVLLMGATPGRAGTRLAQTAWLPVLRALGATPWFGKQVYVGSASHVFDAEGTLTDDATRTILTEAMAGFAAFLR